MCMDGLVQLLMMLTKARTKLIMLMLTKVPEPLLNRIYCINMNKTTYKLH